MEVNQLLTKDEDIVRVLKISGCEVLLINVSKLNSVFSKKISELEEWHCISEADMLSSTGTVITDETDLSSRQRKIMLERYKTISPLLANFDNKRERTRVFNTLLETKEVSNVTLYKWYYLYLAYQNICILAPKERTYSERKNLEYEKIFRYSIRRWYR